jgi:serine/threonine-protein kinase
MAKSKGATQIRFGRYNALTKLGQGAMATVYLAEDPALNRMVAIKVIHSHLSGNSNLLDRFTVEAKTAAGMRNPNIVEVFDYGLEDGAQYLVMEYIDGPNLQFVLNLLAGQPMSPEVAAAVICQAADGLTTAEKSGVVHRDIKPENMMFKSDGVLKIADFGIAHISEQNMTQTGSILGSPNFMSPEQVEGQKPTHMTDMFSLGAVFYYCLSGRKPFSGPNIPTIMRQICDMPHEPVASLAPDADPALVGLVDTLLQKDPAQRGKGARWLSLQLRTWLTQRGILDLSDVTRGFLEQTGKLAGNQTVVDLTPAPAPDEEAKAPLRPGMRVDRPAATARPGTGIRPGTGVKPGTGIRPGSGIRAGNGTWQAGNPGDSSFSGLPPASRGKNSLMWIGAGVAALVLLGAAAYVIFGGNHPAPEPDKKEQPQPPKPPALASLSLQPNAMELQAGQKRKFLADVQPAGASAQVRWESADPSIASVQDGEVWANRPGTTTIKAVSLEDASKQATAEVTVAAAQPEPQPKTEYPQPKHDTRPVETGKAEGHKGKGKGMSGPTDGTAATGSNGMTGSGTTGPDGSGEGKPDRLAGFKSLLSVTTAPPFAEVIVDGRFVGTTPIKDKELPAGKHRIQISHRSFPPIDTTVNLGPGEKTLRFRLFN